MNWACAASPSRSTDLPALIEQLAADGYGLIGGMGEHEDTWRMAYVRGPEGLIVALAQRVG